MSERIQLKAGDAAPAFSAPGLDGEPVTLESFAGRGLVLYFYPKDNTAGCTLEAQGFRDWPTLRPSATPLPASHATA